MITTGTKLTLFYDKFPQTIKILKIYEGHWRGTPCKYADVIRSYDSGKNLGDISCSEIRSRFRKRFEKWISNN